MPTLTTKDGTEIYHEKRDWNRTAAGALRFLDPKPRDRRCEP